VLKFGRTFHVAVEHRAGKFKSLESIAIESIFWITIASLSFELIAKNQSSSIASSTSQRSVFIEPRST
jgi:hypothetical protein